MRKRIQEELLAQQRKLVLLQKSANQTSKALKERELDLAEDRLNFEKSTKDRVDISKEEFLELLDYKQKYHDQKDWIMKIFNPVAGRDEDAFRQLCDGEVDEISLNEYPDYMSNKTKKFVTFVLTPKRK